MKYMVCREVFYKEIEGDFLAYSAQSGETTLLHKYAFQILQYLAQPFSYIELLEMLKHENSSDGLVVDLDMFLRDTLHELIERGFVNAGELI